LALVRGRIPRPAGRGRSAQRRTGFRDDIIGAMAQVRNEGLVCTGRLDVGGYPGSTGRASPGRRVIPL
jgi:hypothetical protein